MSFGIQIRLGDYALGDSHCRYDICHEVASMYFECARQLEADLRSKEKANGGDLNVVWYVLSDCKGLRKNSKELFGDKVSNCQTFSPNGCQIFDL